MDTWRAFAMGEANRGKEMMVFDWNKAARLIRERGAQSASAGLANDWKWTGGEILRDGVPVPREETYTYLASTGAMPEVEIDGVTEGCFVMQSEAPGWGSDTYWPDTAIALLSAGEI